MVLQAWGAYGTVWPVVHQQLGVRPDLGRDRLEVVPSMTRLARPLWRATYASAMASSRSPREAGDGTYTTTVEPDTFAGARWSSVTRCRETRRSPPSP